MLYNPPIGGASNDPYIDANPSLGIEGSAVPAAAIEFAQREIVNVITAVGLTPSNGDLTQLRQAIAQMINAGGAIKTPVRAATTANIASLAGGAPNTLDGVTLAANDRILVKDQTTGSQNGLYVVTTLGTGANGTWTRATDADGAGEIIAGMLVVVAEGTVNADTEWELTTNAPITIGTTSLAFQRFVSTADFGSSLSASGYQKLPSGLIIQWGSVTATYAGTAVTFPVAFPTACRAVTTGVDGTTNASGENANPYNITASGFSIYSYVPPNTAQNATAWWMAIGY